MSSRDIQSYDDEDDAESVDLERYENSTELRRLGYALRRRPAATARSPRRQRRSKKRISLHFDPNETPEKAARRCAERCAKRENASDEGGAPVFHATMRAIAATAIAADSEDKRRSERRPRTPR